MPVPPLKFAVGDAVIGPSPDQTKLRGVITKTPCWTSPCYLVQFDGYGGPVPREEDELLKLAE